MHTNYVILLRLIYVRKSASCKNTSIIFMSILLQTLKIHHNLAETKTLQIQLQ